MIVHIGMPKTGTSSIQESLVHGMRDPRFVYVGLGLVNGSRALQCLVGDQPVAAHLHPSQGIDREGIRRSGPRFQSAWDRQLARARRTNAIPIVSAEDCWFFAKPEWERLAEMIATTGHRAHIIAYLRPPLAWLASMFQELLKSGHSSFADELLVRDGTTTVVGRFGCDYGHRLALIEDVFGKDALTVRAFRPDALPGGCVVADFCGQAGITMPRRSIRRVNESLGLDATRLLYAYNRHTRSGDNRSFRNFLLLLRRLQECPGPPLRLHPDILRPVRSLLEGQLTMLRARYGVDLSEDSTGLDVDAIRSDEDMLKVSPAALEWLDVAKGSRATDARGSPRSAEAVADGVRRIRPRLRHRIEDVVRGRLRQWCLARSLR